MPGYLSPTRTKTAHTRCLRLWAFSEVFGRNALSASSELGAAIGTRYHKDAERWILKGQVPDPEDGKTKEEKEEIELRRDLLIAAIDSGEIPHPFDETALVEHDVVMDDITGRLDLFWKGKLRDHKTTKDAKQYAPTPEELEQDIQANFYGLACMIEMDLDSLDCVWLYMCRKTRTCNPVYFTLLRTRSQALWDATLPTRQKMQALIDNPPEDPLQIVGASNPASCEMYGGCKFKGECKMGDPMDKFIKKQKIEVNPGPAREDAPPVEELEEKKPAKKKPVAKKKPTKKKPAAKPKAEAAPKPESKEEKKEEKKECCEPKTLDLNSSGAFLVVPVGEGSFALELLEFLSKR